MAFPVRILDYSNGLDALNELKNHFIVEDKDKIWVAPYTAQKSIENVFTRQTITTYATVNGFIRYRKPEGGKKNQQLEVWLPDVKFHALIMSAFSALEKSGYISKTEVKKGNVVYRYAPLNDIASKKTILGHKGSIVLEIFGNVAKYLSDKEVNNPV